MKTESIALRVLNTSENFQILDFIIQKNGTLDYKDLKNISLPENIDFSKGVIINGKGPIWLYVYLAHLCHPSAWIATVDPRIGAVVVESHKPGSPMVGEFIERDSFMKYLQKPDLTTVGTISKSTTNKIIAFLGPPHSGKSTFMNLLRVKLAKVMKPEEYQRKFFIIRGCPDGEGDWYSDIPPEIAKTFRYKHPFDNEFLSAVCSSLEQIKEQKDIIFVDCGGKIDKKNQCILNHCTHAFIISKDETKIAEWRGLALGSELKIIAEIKSEQFDCENIITTNPLMLQLGKLEHGRKINIPEIIIEAIIN